MLRHIILALFLIILNSSLALGHEVWIFADNPSSGKILSIDVGYGHDFPKPDVIPDEEYGLFSTKLIGPKGEISLTPGKPNYVWNTGNPIDKGSYIASVNVAPSFWTKSPEGWAMKRKDEVAGAITCTNDFYSGKAIINIDSTGNNKPITDIVGLPLEIIPSVNPASVKPGDKLPLKVILYGKPAFAAKVEARYAGFREIAGSGTYALSGVTDKDGRVNFVPLKEGDWMVIATTEADYADLAVCDKISYFTSLHFKINK
jgi:uncharacterized GH25 family protein